jgi:hypothetical protein
MQKQYILNCLFNLPFVNQSEFVPVDRVLPVYMQLGVLLSVSPSPAKACSESCPGSADDDLVITSLSLSSAMENVLLSSNAKVCQKVLILIC